ncbi:MULTISPECIES: transposase [unclassified Colwellia]|nr:MULTISPECIES: transposase [unclassified Colwellia]
MVQKCRDKKAANRFFRKFLKGQRIAPIKIVTGKLRSYSAMPEQRGW